MRRKPKGTSGNKARKGSPTNTRRIHFADEFFDQLISSPISPSSRSRRSDSPSRSPLSVSASSTPLKRSAQDFSRSKRADRHEISHSLESGDLKMIRGVLREIGQYPDPFQRTDLTQGWVSPNLSMALNSYKLTPPSPTRFSLRNSQDSATLTPPSMFETPPPTSTATDPTFAPSQSSPLPLATGIESADDNDSLNISDIGGSYRSTTVHHQPSIEREREEEEVSSSHYHSFYADTPSRTVQRESPPPVKGNGESNNARWRIGLSRQELVSTSRPPGSVYPIRTMPPWSNGNGSGAAVIAITEDHTAEALTKVTLPPRLNLLIEKARIELERTLQLERDKAVAALKAALRSGAEQHIAEERRRLHLNRRRNISFEADCDDGIVEGYDMHSLEVDPHNAVDRSHLHARLPLVELKLACGIAEQVDECVRREFLSSIARHDTTEPIHSSLLHSLVDSGPVDPSVLTLPIREYLDSLSKDEKSVLEAEPTREKVRAIVASYKSALMEEVEGSVQAETRNRLSQAEAALTERKRFWSEQISRSTSQLHDESYQRAVREISSSLQRHRESKNNNNHSILGNSPDFLQQARSLYERILSDFESQCEDIHAVIEVDPTKFTMQRIHRNSARDVDASTVAGVVDDEKALDGEECDENEGSIIERMHICVSNLRQLALQAELSVGRLSDMTKAIAYRGQLIRPTNGW